jgi:hypothetical protein
LRSTRLFCRARNPEICWVVYQAYATTAINVMMSPRNSPAEGDRTDARCTAREYNGHKPTAKLLAAVISASAAVKSLAVENP